MKFFVITLPLKGEDLLLIIHNFIVSYIVVKKYLLDNCIVFNVIQYLLVVFYFFNDLFLSLFRFLKLKSIFFFYFFFVELHVLISDYLLRCLVLVILNFILAYFFFLFEAISTTTQAQFINNKHTIILN